MSQQQTSRQPEPKTNLVERMPVEDGPKLSKNQIFWEDLRGLSWVLMENEFDSRIS